MKRVTFGKFLKEFVSFFGVLHAAVTGSRIVAVLDNLTIYEVVLPNSGPVNFFFFYGSEEERCRLYPELASNMAGFLFDYHPGSTMEDPYKTVHAEIAGKYVRFPCSFGYVLRTGYFRAVFKNQRVSPRNAAWEIVKFNSHEIRHEIQYFHGLPATSLRKRFPKVAPTDEDIDWMVQQNGFEAFYQESYVQSKDYKGRKLARERDAIVTEFMAVHVHSQDPRCDPATLAERIAPLIRS